MSVIEDLVFRLRGLLMAQATPGPWSADLPALLDEVERLRGLAIRFDDLACHYQAEAVDPTTFISDKKRAVLEARATTWREAAQKLRGEVS